MGYHRIAMGYHISTPINVMLYEAREVSLKLRFGFLTRKFLIKSFARDFNPVIESLESLMLTVRNRLLCIRLLRFFPIFKYFVSLQYMRNIVYSSSFLPSFFL